MKIGVSGCSHSTPSYGKSWVNFLSEKYNPKIIETFASGVGNEIHIEKIKYIFENHKDLDFHIFQLTDPSRLVLGIDGNNIIDEYKNRFGISNVNLDQLCSERFFKNASYYTFTVRDSATQIDRVLKNVNPIQINDFFVNHILTSEYNLNLKVFHTLMTLQTLSEFYNKKILFFSWFVDIKELAEKSGYADIIKNMNIIDGYVEDFTKKNKVPKLSVDNYHYGSESQEIIFKEYLEKPIEDFIKNKL